MISLLLSESELEQGPTDLNGVPCVSSLANQVSCHDTVESEAPVHYAFCEVSEDGPESCPEPVASAHDHHDGDIEVITTRRLFVRSDPHKAMVISNELVTTIDYSQRGEYTLLYEASDRAGNKANAMIFHMFVRDTKPPQLSPGVHSDDLLQTIMGHHNYVHVPGAETTVAPHGGYANHHVFKLPPIRAFDAYDGDVGDTGLCLPASFRNRVLSHIHLSHMPSFRLTSALASLVPRQCQSSWGGSPTARWTASTSPTQGSCWASRRRRGTSLACLVCT